MGIFFEPHQTDHCCLCGSSESLTGEHKVKASALRSIFGRDAMVIGNFDGESSPRFAQGPKSRAFHFSARMCATCNSALTQAPDREFDRFHEMVCLAHENGMPPDSVFSSLKYEIDSEGYLNVFRYFAKLLCCQVAESGGPRPIELTQFAQGRTKRNIVFLHIDSDPTYSDYLEIYGEHQYAAHGGLIVPTNAKTELPTSFRSSLTLGAVRYIFWVEMGPMMGVAIKMFHRGFWMKCDAAYREALSNPLSDDQRRRLGI